MAAKLISGPVALAVSLADARLNLRDPDVALNPVIEAWVRGIIDFAEHEMGRAIIHQTWRLQLDAFAPSIRLPRPPVSSVSLVKYYDTNNVQQTLDPARYQLDNVSEPCRLLPSPGNEWPDTYDRVDAVMIDVLCGYGADDTKTPAGIKSFILAKLVEQFDASAREEGVRVYRSFIDRLLDRYTITEL